MSDDIRKWLKTIPVVTDADKAELREAITKLEAQQRGTRNAETMLCEMLQVDDGSQILDAIQGLKERIKRLEEAGDGMLPFLFSRLLAQQMEQSQGDKAMTRKCLITIEFKVDGQTPPDDKIIEAFQSVMPAGYIGSEGIDGTNKWGIDIISTDTLLECQKDNETKP